MKAIVRRGSKISSVFTAMLTICAWFAISNHCLLGSMAREEKPPADQCPFHSKQSAPAKQKESSDSPCCKILRALVPAITKGFAPKTIALDRINFGAAVIATPPKIAIPASAFDTGPPGAVSFAELILQRSILAHAPPSRI
jgi:hypothetical protein